MTGQLRISKDLQKVLGDIEHGAEERMELLRGQKRALETGSKEEMKPVLGHIEKVETEEVMEAEKEEMATGEADPPRKQRTTQSVAALKDARQKQFMADQEHRWMEPTGGRYGLRPKPKASASLGAPVQSATVASTTSTTTAAVSSTVETEKEIDLEEVMHGQGEKKKATTVKSI